MNDNGELNFYARTDGGPEGTTPITSGLWSETGGADTLDRLEWRWTPD